MTETKTQFPLVDSSYDNKEILSAISVLLSGQLTMSKLVKKFELEFSQYLNSPYSVMTNSGSSSNLLVFSALTNPARKNHLKAGDKVAIPAICWPTSLWPIVQNGLIPVMIDSDPKTLNLSMPALKAALEKHKIKAIMMVHILGNSTDLSELLEIVNNNDMILIEDTCESLGAKYNKKYLGTIGDFSTFSFFFSHHMTTIEGGMICVKNQEDADLLKCMRAHGWSREASNRSELEDQYNYIDPRFLFINMGYNLRPMEIQAAFGLEQLKRLSQMNDARKINYNKIKDAFIVNRLWNNQIEFPYHFSCIEPCWFGFPIMISDRININKNKLSIELRNKGIDTRPIVSGNMAIQPAVRLFDIDMSMGPFNGAQAVHDRGLFIGCHSKELEMSRIQDLVHVILNSLK